MTPQVVAQTQIEIATDPGVGSLEAKIVLIILALLNGDRPGQKAGQVAEQDLLAHLTTSGNYSRWQVRRALEVLKGKGYIGREDGQVTVSTEWIPHAAQEQEPVKRAGIGDLPVAPGALPGPARGSRDRFDR